MSQPVIIGYISKAVIDTLGLDIEPNTAVYIGESNIEHMQADHAEDYKKYSYFMGEIIETPDLVGLNHKDGSIEYIKRIWDFRKKEYVKLAVRVSINGKYYAKTLYTMTDACVRDRAIKNNLFPLDKI
jgi:hypothetical protein